MPHSRAVHYDPQKMIAGNKSQEFKETTLGHANLRSLPSREHDAVGKRTEFVGPGNKPFSFDNKQTH